MNQTAPAPVTTGGVTSKETIPAGHKLDSICVSPAENGASVTSSTKRIKPTKNWEQNYSSKTKVFEGDAPAKAGRYVESLLRTQKGKSGKRFTGRKSGR